MTKTKPAKLSEETIESVIRLGEVLRSILARLVDEGKAKIVDGKIIWKDNDNHRGITKDASRKI